MITNNQWMTIARNIEAQSTNWSGGTVGSGHLSRGWTAASWSDGFSNTAPAPTTGLSCLYNTAADTCGTTGDHKLKRTHILSNNETIWDFSGNVWTWVDELTADPCDQPGNACDFAPEAGDWIEWTLVTNYGVYRYDQLRPSNPSWNSTNSIGRLWRGNRTNRVWRRGGSWSYGSIAGVFTLYLSRSATDMYTYVGFRCAR